MATPGAAASPARGAVAARAASARSRGRAASTSCSAPAVAWKAPNVWASAAR